MKVKLGTYTGNGADGRAITGVGFQPDVVLIKGVSQEMCVRTSSMSGDLSKPSFITNAALAADLIQSLDTDGFTLGTNAAVNANTTVYYWLALQVNASNCVVGSYTGNGGASQGITGVGFQPTLAIVIPANTEDPVYLPTDLDAAGATACNFEAAHATGLINSLDADGFTAGTNRNTNAATYHYIALKDLAGVFGTFTYTGNGSDNRSVAISPGYTPQFALTKRNGSGEATLRFKDHSGDSATSPSATWGNYTNGIQAFESGGIQVGTDSWSNAITNRYDGFWFVEFNDAVSTSVTGQMASASAAAVAATVQAVRSALIGGELATAGSTALAATVTAGADSPAEIAGAVAVAQAVALEAVISATRPVEIPGSVATAQAEAIAAVIAASANATVGGVLATALANVLAADLLSTVLIAGEEAEAQASVRPADVITTVPEPPIGSGGGGAVGGGSGTVGTGGSPAGFNYGVCALDFAIDSIFLSAMPLAIERIGPKHEIRTSPRGYALPSLREGREWRFQWGEQYVDIATVSELRRRLGTALTHTFSWTEPDTTPMEIVGSLKEVEYQWSQDSPGLYSAVILHVLEHER